MVWPPGTLFREHAGEALLGLDKYVLEFTDDQPAYLFAIATCLAAELAARNGMPEQAMS